MQEIKIAGNKTGLRVLIDEPPDVRQRVPHALLYRQAGHGHSEA